MADKLRNTNADASGRETASAPKRGVGQPSRREKPRSELRDDTPESSAPEPEAEPREGDDERLDEALKESFPASDPLPINPGPTRTS